MLVVAICIIMIRQTHMKIQNLMKIIIQMINNRPKFPQIFIIKISFHPVFIHNNLIIDEYCYLIKINIQYFILCQKQQLLSSQMNSYLIMYLYQYLQMYNKKKEQRNSSVINSAALQDHLIKKSNYNLNFNPIKFFDHKHKNQFVLPNIQKNTKKVLLEKQQTNHEHSTNKKGILPYQTDQIKKLKEQDDETVKMIKYNKKLTLAQRLGIIEAPPPPLSSKQWEKIQDMSKKRKDSQNVCSICLQDFRLTPQTILSCSHVFHMNCLNSFQKHNKLKACPICRRRDYEKKVIDEGIRIFTMKCIIKIQSILRGSRTRKWLYKKLVESGYKATSKLFNRRLIGYKMWKLSNKIAQNMKKNEQIYKTMLVKLQKNFKENNDKLFEHLVQYQRNKIKNTDDLNQYIDRVEKLKNPKNYQIKQQQELKFWQNVQTKALQRQDHTCSICLMNLFSKETYLLSCSHMFHVNCLNSFERYSVPNNICPCCRSKYEKRVFKKVNK